jgi:hypothetical protein
MIFGIERRGTAEAVQTLHPQTRRIDGIEKRTKALEGE